MRRVIVERPDDVEDWLAIAKDLLGQGVAPAEVVWEAPGRVSEEQPSLLDMAVPLDMPASPPAPSCDPAAAQEVRLPPLLVELARSALLHRDTRRFGLLYSLAWRALHDEPYVAELATDQQVRRVRTMARQVEREVERMHALVRFREAEKGGSRCYVAWFEPQHHVLRAAAPFFVERFKAMRWTILTPYASALWDTRELTFGPGATRDVAPPEGAVEEAWRDYYRHASDPARLNPKLMSSFLPRRYWDNLPEKGVILEAVHGAKPLLRKA